MSMESAEVGRESAKWLCASPALLLALWLHSEPVEAQTTTTTVTTTNCVTDSYGNCITSSSETTTIQTTDGYGYGGAAVGWGPGSVRGVARRTSRRTARRVSRRR